MKQKIRTASLLLLMVLGTGLAAYPAYGQGRAVRIPLGPKASV